MFGDFVYKGNRDETLVDDLGTGISGDGKKRKKRGEGSRQKKNKRRREKKN